MKNLLTHYAAGLCGNPLTVPPTQPPTPDSAEKYSYNGVVLPKLPEWDTTVYPYAVIQWCSMSADREPYFAKLTVSDQPLFVAQGEIKSHLVAKNPVAYMKVNCLDGEGSDKVGTVTWGEFRGYNSTTASDRAEIGADAYHVESIYEVETFVGGAFIVKDYRLLWTNHPICNLVTDEIVLAASEPVPVYE